MVIDEVGGVVVEQVVLKLAERRSARRSRSMLTATAEPSKMLFIASKFDDRELQFLPSIGRGDRLEGVRIVVERVVEQDRLERCRPVVSSPGTPIDVHALAGVGDRVVVHVEVDRLARRACRGPGRAKSRRRSAVIVRSERSSESGWTKTAASEKSDEIRIGDRERESPR